MTDAIFIISNIFSDVHDYNNISVLALKFRGLGLQISDIVTSIVFLVFLIVIEFIDQRKGIEQIFKQKPIIKWIYYYILLISIVFWGTKNSAANFIYFQF